MSLFVGLLSIATNGNWLCDGGFYTQRTFKTAIAKPVLCEVPTYLALNFNRSNKTEKQKEKSVGKIK